MKTVDVLVVGAGLAGLNVARLLAARGLAVLLVDRKQDVAATVCTTGIFVRRTLADFALPESCLGPPIRTVQLYSPARRRLLLESAQTEFRIGDMAGLYRRFFKDALESGVQWRGGHRFIACLPANGYSTVVLECGNEEVEMQARYIVGADGAVSRTAGQLGLSENREFLTGVEHVYRDACIAGPPALHCYVDPELAPGYIGWVANDGIEAHVGVAGRMGRFDPKAALRRFEAEVRDGFDNGRAVLAERRGGRIPVGGLLRCIVNRRGLLLGDAAGAVSPLTAGGLDPCLRQSALAAQVAASYLEDENPARLAAYASPPFRRRFLLRRMLRRGMACVRSRWMAEIGCAALAYGPFRSLARHIFFGRGSFPIQAEQSALPVPVAERGH